MPIRFDDAAEKPNPRLEPLRVLVGTWTTVGTHPLVPGKTFHGSVSFSWIHGGAFLLMRSQIDEPEIPTAVAVFGTDDASDSCSMLYFDERGVSRRYEVRIDGNEWHWWRDAPDFAQRFVGSISSVGRTIVGRDEYSRNDGPWEPDLALTYTRVDQ